MLKVELFITIVFLFVCWIVFVPWYKDYSITSMILFMTDLFKKPDPDTSKTLEGKAMLCDMCNELCEDDGRVNHICDHCVKTIEEAYQAKRNRTDGLFKTALTKYLSGSAEAAINPKEDYYSCHICQQNTDRWISLYNRSFFHDKIATVCKDCTSLLEAMLNREIFDQKAEIYNIELTIRSKIEQVMHMSQAKRNKYKALL